MELTFTESKTETVPVEIWAMRPAVTGWEIRINSGVWRDGIANSETLEHIVEEHNQLVRAVLKIGA